MPKLPATPRRTSTLPTRPALPSRPTTSEPRPLPSAGSVIVTECDQSRTLSEICGCNLWLKFENLQFTSTFKERGALNRLLALSPDERRRGVIAMSAGNHAQGVAYHANRLGIPATIVMPVGTPMVKIENTRRHGAETIISGKTLEEAAEFARAHGKAQNLTMIHPYDDPLIIAGQGTIALEMLAAVPRARHAGGSDRRRRADLRHGGRGQGAEAGIADRRRAGRSSIPRCTTPSRASTCRCAATRWPKASPSRRRAGSPPTIIRRLVDDIVLVDRGPDRACGGDADRDREDRGRGRRRGGPCRACWRRRSVSPGAMSASS